MACRMGVTQVKEREKLMQRKGLILGKKLIRGEQGGDRGLDSGKGQAVIARRVGCEGDLGVGNTGCLRLEEGCVAISLDQRQGEEAG